MDKKLLECLQNDLSSTQSKDIVISCGKYFNEVANRGLENLVNNDRKITIVGDISAEELVTLLQKMVMTTYQDKLSQQAEIGHGVMADGVGNAFIFDSVNHGLLGGIEVNFEGRQVTTEIYSNTADLTLGTHGIGR